MHRSPSTPRLAAWLFVSIAAACLPGCSDTTDDEDFEAASTDYAVAADTPLRVWQRWIVYLADEATTGPGGTDLNGDGDRVDSIATATNLSSRRDFMLEVSAEDIYLLEEEVYVVTDESRDGRDWSGDGDPDDVVLLHWSEASAGLVFVDRIDTGAATGALVAGQRFLYASGTPSTGPETTLRYLEATDPLAPKAIPSGDGLPRDATLLGADGGLVFAALDETIEGTDLNGDDDSTDAVIVALLDATAPLPVLLSTGLAAADAAVPIRAWTLPDGDRAAAFLVSEASHGDLTGGGFNDPRLFDPDWQPPQCAGSEDSDLEDEVLHFLLFDAWSADPISYPPVNTGLAGRDRIVARERYLATISPEDDEGGCDLNEDGDSADRIVRWVEASDPPRPFTQGSQLFAVADTAGGTRGLAELDEAFVIVADESAQGVDLDGDGERNRHLVGWIDPADGPGAAWVFDHGDGPGGRRAATDWMTETLERDRLPMTFLEEVKGVSLNTGDDDALDSVPKWAAFDASGGDLDFPGESVAARAENAGMVISGNVAFFRVDEHDDNRDWNDDGDKTDQALLRTEIDTGDGRYIGILNDLDRPAVVLRTGDSRVVGAAFIADEAMARKDFDDDGDKSDLVVRYFEF
jgi:hypothetical protein